MCRLDSGVRRGAVAIWPLIVVALCGCSGGQIRHRIESGIARALPSKLGPAKSYTVKVSGSTMAMINGRLGAVKILGEEVRLSKGVTVARLDVDIKDLVADPGTQAIKRCGSTVYSATLAQDELQRYLIKTYPDIPGLKVSLANGAAHVLASPGLAGVKVNIAADATLEVREGRRLALNLMSIDVAGLSAPGFARDFIENRLNPVFDASELGFGARIESVRIDRGSLTLTGTLDLMKALGTSGEANHPNTETTEPRNL